MDELDMKILGDLGSNCRVCYQELSRRYGISAYWYNYSTS